MTEKGVKKNQPFLLFFKRYININTFYGKHLFWCLRRRIVPKSRKKIEKGPQIITRNIEDKALIIISLKLN